MDVQRGLALDRTRIPSYAGLFHALSDPTRLAILQHLTTGEHNVRELVEHMGLAQSTVSKHLACLRGYGLVSVRAEGRSSWFSLAEADRLGEVLSAAEAVLVAADAFVPLGEHLDAAPHDDRDTR